MTRARLVLGSLSAVLLGTLVSAQTTPSESDTHIAAAKTAAGMDFRNTFIALCPLGSGGGRAGAGGARGAAGAGAAADAAGAPGAGRRGAGAPAGAPGGGAGRGAATAGAGAQAPGRAGAAPGRGAGGGGGTPDRATWYAPPFKIFDNFYWLGTRSHSSWAIQTTAGILLIDTNFAYATDPEIVEGLTKLGLKPQDIKYVFISHAHGDHDQGAAEIQKRYGAKVVMGAADWDATLQRAGSNYAGGVPTKDISVGPEGTKITLGDTTVQVVSTPGHTPGTISYVFPVKNQGKTIMVAYSGGTLIGGFAGDANRVDEYVASQQRIAKAAADAGAVVILSNHSEYDGAYTRARLIGAPRQPGEEHPFIVGADNVQKYFTVSSECATASKLKAQGK